MEEPHILTYNFVLAAILIIFTFVFMVLLYFAWKNRDTPISISYGLGVVVASFYTFGYAFQLVSTTSEQMLTWIHFQYLGIPFGPFLWVIMILRFTHNEQFLTKKNIALLLLGPVYTLSAHFTNSLHQLFYKSIAVDSSQGFPLIALDRGPLFYGHIVYAYSYYFIGISLLVHMYCKSNKERKKHIVLMIIGSVLVFSFPLIHSLHLIKIPIDVSPFGLVFSSLFYLWGIYQFNLLKMSPVTMKQIFESVHDAVILFDLDDTLKSYNNSAAILFEEIHHRKLIGETAPQVLAHLPLLAQFLKHQTTQNETATQSMKLKDDYYHVQFSFITGSNHKQAGKMLILHNSTKSLKYEESLRQQSKQYEYLAHHDMLTGIFNRAYFEQEVKRRLALSDQKTGALIVCDLNFFKEINDTYGHFTGDNVLIFTANCWHENLPKPHILARLGGDEFVMFFEQIVSKEQFLQQIKEVRTIFKNEWYKQDTITIEIVPSIGISFIEEEGANYEILYQICDERMYADKKKLKEYYVLNEDG